MRGLQLARWLIVLVAVLSSWGPCVDCPADVDEDDVVDFADLLEVLAHCL